MKSLSKTNICFSLSSTKNLSLERMTISFTQIFVKLLEGPSTNYTFPWRPFFSLTSKIIIPFIISPAIIWLSIVLIV